MHLPGKILTDGREREVREREAREREEKRQRKKEEQRTLDELKRSDKTRRCPGCKIWIEKISGCNHMTCRHCKVINKGLKLIQSN